MAGEPWGVSTKKSIASIANVISDTSRRLRLPFSDGHANPFTELRGKHAVVCSRINHTGKHEIKLTALIFEQGVNLRARHRCLLWERRRWLTRRRRIGNDYLGRIRSRQSCSLLDEHKADVLVRNLNEKRTPLFDLSGSREGFVKAVSVAEYPFLVLRQSDPLTLVGLEELRQIAGKRSCRGHCPYPLLLLLEIVAQSDQHCQWPRRFSSTLSAGAPSRKSTENKVQKIAENGVKKMG